MSAERDLRSGKVSAYDVDLGIGIELAAASSPARSVVHDEGTEAKKDADAGTGLEGTASCAAARARQNEGSVATKLKTPGERRPESG
jgi:hypothetical protein